jgi:hypothetical protein
MANSLYSNEICNQDDQCYVIKCDMVCYPMYPPIIH